MELEKKTRQLRELIEAEDWNALPEQYAQLHMQDIAAAFDDLDPGP